MRRRANRCWGVSRRARSAPLAPAALVVLALVAGCSSARHHRLLSFFFDGVPEPVVAVASTAPGVTASVGRQLVRPGEHGPYAAKLCGACHDAGATNALVLPADQLCLRCHALDTAKAYVHGPLASGGCLVCHDPHRSANRFLLVSASDGFCLHCHDRASLSALPEGNGHGGENADCTDCHEPHMSDRKFLLRPGA